ncbi:hypothetical protein CCACVL1_19170 [Corchorus capsularis]|uniref:Uncharacterized protein n=1 Tax=Corchorus capsularis TaxID=210143 RepID=A0A1R3HI35_COCAP|nr:hypothetical protein CCACVL1_19170 [Corchorus capsularis]
MWLSAFVTYCRYIEGGCKQRRKGRGKPMRKTVGKWAKKKA